LIKPRKTIRFAVACATAFLLSLAALQAQSFQQLTPFLIELPGWQGGKPDGMAMQMPGASMITATREYERGNARLTAQIITGPAAQGALAPIRSGIKIETSDSRMSSSTVDGFAVLRTYQVADKSGAVMVALGAAALFSLNFEGVTEDEALALAQRFNWKAIQAALPR
jgi:hypothetical protein